MSIRALSGLLLVLVGAFPVLAEEESAPAKTKYRGGAVRVGGFFINRMTTTLVVTSNSLPVGARIDATEDLGLEDSASIGRMMLSYRFSRHHRFDFGYYSIDRSATKVLDRTIEIGDTVFPIYAEVSSSVEVDIYKAAYSWVFHEDDKVSLGLSAGLHVVGLGVEMNSTDPLLGLEEKNAVTAPLPVFGFRLAYRATRKFSVIAAADYFFLNYDKYTGSLVDAEISFEHHTFKHVGFGAGLNSFSLDVEVDDDARHWDVQILYRGYLAYVSFYF